jgi:transposase
MKLTEQIQLPHDKRFSQLCHISKNLYNLENYYVRQELETKDKAEKKRQTTVCTASILFLGL